MLVGVQLLEVQAARLYEVRSRELPRVPAWTMSPNERDMEGDELCFLYTELEDTQWGCPIEFT